MVDWWISLDFEKQLLYGIGIVSLALMLFDLILSIIGIGGHSTDLPDIGAATDHTTGLGILSFRTVTAFFTGFGWVGGIALNQGASLPVALIWATLSGLTLMFAIYGVMLLLMRLQTTGTIDIHNAIGNGGSVYIRIPAARSGAGQVEVMVQNRLSIIDAYTDESSEIPPRTRVEIVGVIGNNAVSVVSETTATTVV